jgi:hypothetical protein
VLIANTAHPLDPRASFTCSALQALSRRGTPPTVPRSPEAQRALLNTEAYLSMRGLS